MRSCVRLCRTSPAYIFTHIQMYRLTVNVHLILHQFKHQLRVSSHI
jgi:hypothetical protein